jgi:hypothetical protein
MAKSAADAAQRYLTNAQNAVQAYKDGVGRVQQDPGVAAARQKAAYVNGVTQNADYWAKRVQTGLPNWQQAAQSKGGDRYAGGIQAGAPKMAAFLEKFVPRAQSIAASLPPRGTLEQNLQRMVQQARETAKLRGTF